MSTGPQDDTRAIAAEGELGPDRQGPAEPSVRSVTRPAFPS